MQTMSQFKTVIFSLILLGTLQVFAQFNGDVNYSGSGCPQNTVASSFTEDGGIASFIFDKFTAETTNKKWSDRKYCIISIGVDIPRGYRISKVQAVVNSFFNVPKNAFGTLFAQVYSRDRNNRINLNNYNYIGFYRPFQDSVTLQVDAKAKEVKECPKRKEKVNLYTYLDLWVPQFKTNTAYAAIDSIDSSLASRRPTSYSTFLEPCPQ